MPLKPKMTLLFTFIISSYNFLDKSIHYYLEFYSYTVRSSVFSLIEYYKALQNFYRSKF